MPAPCGQIVSKSYERNKGQGAPLANMSEQPDFDTERRKFSSRLPHWAAAATDKTLGASRWIRWPVALLLVAGGLVGFLPILGFWMIPLGLILVAEDIPFLRPPLARMFAWLDRKWPAKADRH
jgi:hypothetical protein